MHKFKILDREIGPGYPVYIIAEISANHGGSLEAALALVREAKAAGADAVKTQTYTADTLTLKSDREYFRIKGGTLWDGKTLYDLYAEAYTPWEWQPDLKRYAQELGMHFFSSPFDASAVEFLNGIGVQAYKVASFEIVDLPLLEKIASYGKPLIISTGMASFDEISEAVQAVRNICPDIPVALLQCASAYPAAPEDMNLRTLVDMAEKFSVPVGLSDHTLGSGAAIASVALGAAIIEKHLTLSRKDPGPDSAFSMEPKEFQEMVREIRSVEKALGAVNYGCSPNEEKSRRFRRSLFIVADMNPGELFTKANVRSIRPADGLPPKHLCEILGRKARQQIKRGTPLTWDLIAGV